MAATRTYLQTAGNTNALTTYTFSAQNFGTEAADRYIIAVCYTRDLGTGAKTLSSLTIGGQAATIVVQAQGTGSGSNSCLAAIALVALPTGTSGDVVVTWSEAVLRCGLSLYAGFGMSATPHDTASDGSAVEDPSVTLDVPAGGFAIGGWSGTNTVVWTGLTEDHDTAVDSSRISSASAEFASAEAGRAISVNGSGVDPVLVAVSFAADGGGGGGGTILLQMLQNH